MTERPEITADDLLFGCLTYRLVIADTETHHIHTHLRRGLIRALAVDRFEERVKYREYLYVAVIVHRRLARSLQMEGVDHIHVIEIRGSRLVCHVQRVFEREVPYGERLELRIPRLATMLLLVVELT